MSRAVLIVDGDEQYVPLLKDVFHRVHFEVFVAQDSERALALAEKHEPDLILLSVELPAGPAAGYIVCRDLKTTAATKTIPILMTSRRAKEEDFAKHRKLKTRADDYLRKPFTDEELFQRVENILGFELTSEDFEALEAKMHRFLEREDELVAEVADRDRKIRTLEKQLKTTETELETAKAEAAEDTGDSEELEKWRERAESAEAELKLANKRADRASEDAKAGADRMAEFEEELSELETALADAKATAEQSGTELEEVREALDAAVGERDTAQAAESELREQISGLEAQIDELKKAADAAQEAADAAEARATEVGEAQEKLEQDLAAAEEKHTSVEADLKEAERERKKLEKALSKVRTAANKLLEAFPDEDEK